jgi:hypothetical protein
LRKQCALPLNSVLLVWNLEESQLSSLPI